MWTQLKVWLAAKLHIRYVKIPQPEMEKARDALRADFPAQVEKAREALKSWPSSD
jgi:hypothetical protein